MPGSPVRLTPIRDVVAADGRWQASSQWPWLRCETPPLAGRWLRIVYAAGRLDPLMRPVLRFWRGEAYEDEILPAAIWGRAFWIGRAPSDARELWISPTGHPGAFSFRLERFDLIANWRATIKLEASAPGRASRYWLAQATGRPLLARLQARRALGSTPLTRYAAWRAARLRAFEPDFDLPAVAAGPPTRFVISLADGPPAEREATLASLRSQTYPHWALAGAGVDLAPDDLTLALTPGDRLCETALAAFASAARREPRVDLFYADEDRATPSGRRGRPALKPDWSPLRQAFAPYLGAVATRARLSGEGEPPSTTLRAAHVRRVLLTRPTGRIDAAAPAAGDNFRKDIAASIIIPTRDRLDLLSTCVASLETSICGAEIEIVVVDNDSREPATQAWLAAFGRKPRRRVIAAPGPFNFAALSNRGAEAASERFLVFLNNDIEAGSENWLARLLTFAARPEVGAVGAKLLYPRGGVQHGGVVLGSDGLAGHVQRRRSADDPGYLGSLAVPHEVSAVTGACLAIEAAKFAEVGGFDQVHLPVEYNDMDLCLRLAERGYACVLEPRATLTHHESASRGSNRLLDGRYAEEIAYFRERWASRLRDDPLFHPALSLDSLSVALG